MSVAALEERYPYLSGHSYLNGPGRSVACALCGCFREEHAPDKRGDGVKLAENQVRGILQAIDRREGGAR